MDFCEFEDNLIYIVVSRSARLHTKTVLKGKKEGEEERGEGRRE